LAKKKGLTYLGAPLFHISGLCTMSVALYRMNTTVVGPIDYSPSADVACAIVRSTKLNAISAVPFIHDAIFGPNREELKDQFTDLHGVTSFGGELFLIHPTVGSGTKHTNRTIKSSNGEVVRRKPP